MLTEEKLNGISTRLELCPQESLSHLVQETRVLSFSFALSRKGTSVHEYAHSVEV
jgi:hypothetical protein